MNNQNQQDEIEKIEKKVEQGVKDTARKTGSLLGKGLKKGIKLIIHTVGLKATIIILIISIIFMIIPAFWYGVKDRVYDAISEITKGITKDESGKITKITKIDGRKYEIDKEELEERLQIWFKANKVSKQQLGLSEDLTKLEEFMEAEIITSYPDLRERSKIGTEVPEGELQGCVQFHRRMSNGTTTILEYKPYDDFALELAKVGIKLDENQTQQQIYFEKDEVERVYKSLEDKFTLDEFDNLIVLDMVTTQKQVTYSDYAKEEGHVDGDADEYIYDVEPTVINYQDVIQKYTMPFDFCVALLMTSQNYEFCKAVSDLAKDSKIVIDVQDNVTTNITKEVYSFDVDFEIERYVKYYTETKVSDSSYAATGDLYERSETQEYDPYPIKGKVTRHVEPYKTTINILTNNELKLCVRQAKTWIADYNSEYTNIVKTPEIPEIVSEEPDDPSFVEVPDYHGLVKTLPINLPSNAHIVEDRGVVREKKYNKKTVITTTVRSNEYNKSSSEVQESPQKFLSLLKIDPNTGEFDLENLKNNSKLIQYENILKKEKSSPQKNLISGRFVLYEFLGSNSKTVQLKDTMSYLINVYRGKIKARKPDSSNFEIYEPEEFSFVDGGWEAIWKNNYTKEQFIEMVKAYTPPNNTGNGGRSFREYYEKHFIANAENYFDIATSYGLDPMFIFCIGIHESQYGTSNISFKKGNFWGWGAYDATPFQSALSFVGDASKGIETVCSGIANNYISPSGTWYNYIINKGYKPETIEGVGARYATDTSWAAIVKKHITTIFGVSGGISTGEIQLVGDTQSKIVQWAETQIGKSSFYNKAKGSNYNSKKYCAAFVKSAYNEAGLGYINGNAIDVPHPNPMVYNSAGQVDYSNIPVGACIVSKGSSAYGHVALYVGDGYVIEAGGRTIVKQKIDESYGKKYGFLGWGYATVSQTIK